MKSAPVLYLVISCVAAIAVFFVVREVEFGREDELLVMLDEAGQLETEIRLEILKAQGGLSNNFDRLTIAQKRLRAIVRQLIKNPGAIPGPGNKAISTSLAELEEYVRRQDVKIEDFKSSRAVLMNSLKYLPTVLTEAKSAVSETPRDGLRAETFDDLFDQLMIGRLDPSPDVTTNLKSELSQLSKLSRSAERDLGDPVVRFLAHAEAVLEYGSRMDHEAGELLSEARSDKVGPVVTAYRNFNRESQAQQRWLLGLLAGVVTLFCGFIAYSLVNLHAARAALQRVNEGLENRVEERTRELKSINLRLTREVAERRRAEQAKSEFLSVASHELRTPLTSLKGAVNLVRAGALGSVPENFLPLLDIAGSNCERLEALVNDILDIDKIQDGRFELDLAPIEVVSLVGEAMKLNREYATKYDVQFVDKRGTEEIHVMGDHSRLLQVLDNLMSNAVKFSDEGGVVELSTSISENAAQVEVKDYGRGIASEHRVLVFERFTQIDSSDTREKGGTGLGLSIAKAIVEAHGGEIDFGSEPGVGTAFYFTLPLPTSEGARSAV